MKKVVNILFSIAILLNPFIPFLYVDADKTGMVETTKKNKDSYWSVNNAPIFYGATKITIKKGIIDNFDVLDTRFRIFAKDFEDGDLTTDITYTGEVNVNQVGTYEINYKVKDSHNNETKLTVPVIVTDDANAKINVERTLYTIPSVWNMDLAGFSRCNYGDRQILGIYMPKESSVKARILSSDNDISVNFITNDTAKEISQTIKNDGNWITIQNKLNDGTYEDAVPYFRTTVLKTGDVSKVFKIELEYDVDVWKLDYYHYKDNEKEYFDNWRNSKATYSVVENEVVSIVVPFTDINKMVNHNAYSNAFLTLDSFLSYYQKVVDKMDEYVGLDLNPVKLTDQNVRTKYLVRANIHGAGAAYYNGNHVGVNSASVSSFFQMNWGGLHELAHGYQGNLGKGQMNLGETANNIIGHYIQIDKNIYFYPGDWLGELKKIEEKKNSERLEGKKYTSTDVSTRLYMIINLFDYFEGGTTYGKIFSWYREKLNNGTLPTNKDANQDIYSLAIADIYHVDITPYMEAWNLDISDSVKETISSKNYPSLTILKDMVSEKSLDDIMQGENLDIKYGLVKNDIYNKYHITGDLNLNISIDNIEKLKGKKILIKSGDKTVKTVKINSSFMKIEGLNLGSYYLQMPILNGYDQNRVNILIKEGNQNNYTYNYEKFENIDVANYLSVILQGVYETVGCKLTFMDHYKKAKVEFGGADFNGIQNAIIKIMDQDENVLLEEKKGYDNKGNFIPEDPNGRYFNFNQDAYEVDLKPGYIIEITHSRYDSRVKWNSTLLNEIVQEYTPTSETTRYIVMDDGIRMEGMDKDTATSLAYTTLKKYIINQINSYKEKVTEKEIKNRFINFKEKARIINLHSMLKEIDQQDYNDFIEKIKKGGSPVITYKGQSQYKVGTNINLYSLISATDNEDGDIIIDNDSTTINSNLDIHKVGTYEVTYSVMDSDLNKSVYKLTIKMVKDVTSNDSEKNKEETNDKKLEKDKQKNEGKKISSNNSTKQNNNEENNKLSKTLSTNENKTTNENKENDEIASEKVEEKSYKDKDITVKEDKEDVSKTKVEKKNFIDQWLDDEYTIFEVVVAVIIMFAMAVISTYLFKR